MQPPKTIAARASAGNLRLGVAARGSGGRMAQLMVRRPETRSNLMPLPAHRALRALVVYLLSSVPLIAPDPAGGRLKDPTTALPAGGNRSRPTVGPLVSRLAPPVLMTLGEKVAVPEKF